ncbi:hypothetical protein GCM10010211_65090 [Streptomyces albospinus]|uniref:Transposase n=1 Tax=Streptomyces albospinus TaxID=285515 RepID=A0ABQ2VJR0_9ACTN|nr:hypothetical protein GCM10010211_65090 [Streptomyces albospinus]
MPLTDYMNRINGELKILWLVKKKKGRVGYGGKRNFYLQKEICSTIISVISK